MRILLLCPQISRRDQLNKWLAKKFIVDRVFSIADFFEKFHLYDYDLLMIDSFRTSWDCRQIVEEIKKEQPNLPIIILLKNQAEAKLEEYLSLQINAIFYQNNCIKEFCQSGSIKLGELNFDYEHSHFLLRDRVVDLPRREHLLLAQLFLHHRQFLSKNQIAQSLLRDYYSINSNLIDVYIYRLRKFLRSFSPDLQIKRHHYLGYKITACN